MKADLQGPVIVGRRRFADRHLLVEQPLPGVAIGGWRRDAAA